MDQNLDYQSTRPVPRANQIRPIPITHSPKKLVLASLVITIPRRNANHNQVELNAEVGIQGLRGTSQVLFKIFRDGEEVFRSQQRVRTGENQLVTLHAVDTNVGEGPHTYKLTAENTTNGTDAAVVGPITFNALASSDPEGDRNQNRDRDRDRNRDRDRRHDRDRNREMNFEREEGRGRGTNQDRGQNRDQSRNQDRDQDRDRNRDFDRSFGRFPAQEAGQEMERDGRRNTGQNREKERDRDRDRDRDRERNKDRRRDFFSDPLRGIDQEIDRFIKALDIL